jgi:hypothetical protein
MSSRFEKIAQKTDELAGNNRRALNDARAKIALSANKKLGKKVFRTKIKSKPKSKVARGMELFCGIIAAGLALLIININIWPFTLINGGGRDLSISHAALLFIGLLVSFWLLGLYIVRPIAKRLEAKYGEQAW